MLWASLSAAGAEVRPVPPADPWVRIYRDAVDRRMEEPASRRSKPAERIGTAYAAWLLAARTGPANRNRHANVGFRHGRGWRIGHTCRMKPVHPL